MDAALSNFARDAEKCFQSNADPLKDEGLQMKADALIYRLSEYKIGPRLLLLLVTYSFPRQKRERIWKDFQTAVSRNK